MSTTFALWRGRPWLFSGTRSLSRAHVCAFRPRAARTPRPLGPARSPRPLASRHPVVGRLAVGPELLGHLGDRSAGGDYVVGGLAPELVGVLVITHALPCFLGCLSIYDSWVLNLGCPCPKKRYRSLRCRSPYLHLRQLPLGAQDALAPEVLIGTVQGEQLIVCALFLNGSRRIQNDDLIGHLDSLQLVGDGNHRR